MSDRRPDFLFLYRLILILIFGFYPKVTMDLHDYRQQYSAGSLGAEQLTADPFELFQRLFFKAKENGMPEPNAMTLATADENGADARIVLLKEVNGQSFVFFTNYNSAKGRQLAFNSHAALLFWWHPIECQVRIRGAVDKISAIESDAYFLSRPHDSKAGAIVSAQSEIVKDYDDLIRKYESLKALDDAQLVRPGHWGGYALIPVEFEFWQGRPNRMHDRFRYRLESGDWRIDRLSP